MPTDKESYKLSGKKRTRVERRKANVTTRIKKNVEMVKNTQKGNIDEKTGLVKSGKNKNRQRTLKRQKSKLDRINTRLDKKVASKPTTTPKVSKKKIMAKVNSIQARTKTSTTPKATNTKLTRKQKVTKRMTGSAMKAAYMGKLGKASKILGRLKFRKGVQVTTTHPDNKPAQMLHGIKPKKVKRAKYYK